MTQLLIIAWVTVTQLLITAWVTVSVTHFLIIAWVTVTQSLYLLLLPHSSIGGVAYVTVFNSSATFRWGYKCMLVIFLFP